MLIFSHQMPPLLFTRSCLLFSPFFSLNFILPARKTHRATLRYQSCLLTDSCCASFQVKPLPFRSCRTMLIGFFLDLPGFCFCRVCFQYTACFGNLPSYMCKMCPSLLFFTIRFYFCSLSSSLQTEMPIMDCGNLRCAASNCSCCAT